MTLLVGGPRLRHRFLIAGAIVAAMVAIAVQSALAPSVTAEVAARAQSALSTSVLQSSSLTDRADEFTHALSSIAHHPWFGVGWFQNYGSYAGGLPRLGVEDWYLHLATDLGLPVAARLPGLVAVLLAYGVRRARQATNALDRGLVAAGVGALTALLLSLVVGTYLQDPNTMAAFGFTCGFLVAAGLRAAARARLSADRREVRAR